MSIRAHGVLGGVLSCNGTAHILTCPRWVSVTLMQPDSPGGSHCDPSYDKKDEEW